MMAYIEKGSFPQTRLPERPKHSTNFPDIKWIELFEPEKIVYMEYQDASGVVSSRYVMLTCKGEGGGNEYFGGYDAEFFKTFRVDRVQKLEVLGVKK